MGNSDIIWYSIVDFLLLSIAAYGILIFLNSVKGMRYLGIVFVATATLIISSFLRFPGLHIAVQAVILVLLVSFPIIFHERWAQLLSGAPATTPGHFNKITLGITAMLVSAVMVFIGAGALVKIAELPSEIPVEAVNLPTGMTADFGGGKTVRVIISAPRDIWESLNGDNFSATVDAANRAEGTYDVDIIVTSQIDSVRIISIKPSKAVITIEPVIKKTVPVSIKVSGTAGKELVPGEAKIEPDKVEIAGPKSEIADISQVYAEIKLNGETETIKLDAVDLVALDATGELIPSIEIKPAAVKLTLPLVKAGNSKVVTVTPVFSGTPAVGYWVESVSVEPAVVSVLGSAEALTNLKQIKTARISLDGISSTSSQNIALDLPSGVTVADDTAKVLVKITIAKADTTKSVTPQFVYDGLSSSLKVSSTSPTSISAIVSGAGDILKNLSSGDVKLKLNLAPYKSAGTYSVQIENSAFVLPGGVSLVSFLPSAIDVTLENR
ncbi:MAG: CdaR family protein [Patescibacteria group bacterium]